MSPSVLEWENLRLDRNSCQVTYKNNLLNLTPLEYGLVELFLQNSQQVFSLTELLESLWAMRKQPKQKAVRWHIQGLRHKLKAAGAPANFIETVYGLGYRLCRQKTFCTSSKASQSASLIETFPSADSQSDDPDSSTKEEEQRNLPIHQFSPSPLHPSNLSFQPFSLCVPPSFFAVPALSVPDPHQLPTQLQIQAAMVSVWQRFKDKIVARVIVIEQAIAAVRLGELSEGLRSEAESEAHKLAGSLGTFGFPCGSLLAKEIEEIFNSGAFLGENEALHLGELLAVLRNELLETEKYPGSG
ncbi:winged helix-turn-helix domain-containing protein [Microcoleus sp. FACHB-831]|uniref:winged helix-turn-helix domain-containing protein n=1 Tax=Microcoleus sp. FACHB-831 TaxID=2692827 RepID=UPI0016843F51|nr:winged helix-turn-helix domain-containing protein [Microcoleus sp. FACHB-831]MBD1919952.1 winged helix-turn-helix domain-containing protein [Microcoleus sp. FACHB-831]